MEVNVKRIVEDLKKFFENRNNFISYVIVFGSQVSGFTHFESDLDIGLRPVKGFRKELVKILPDLVVDLADYLRFPVQRLDVTLIDPFYSKNLSFLYEALSNCIFVWGDREQYIDDLVYVASLYADHRIELEKTGYFEAYLKAYREAVKNGKNC